MAKESSFDVVSEVNMQEADNAYQQAQRELAQRYDLKQTGATISFDKQLASYTIAAPSEFVAGQVIDVLRAKLSKRAIDLNALSIQNPTPAQGGSVKQEAKLIQGIQQDVAKKIAKDIRDLKLKCKAIVEGDKLRVSSASRDTLQEVIAALKERDYGQPLQFTNYR
ncbi:hypothetical protein HMPREF9248_0146 [Fannyhessea vaginae PB189-T1-4]|jgi:hypothetical protein|uniref:Nucleotide-binding protein HMPREF9248_0146 n=1 Tax=Fannyhessea vaginae PB189-T1-4 TaxID=866774 RepID=A0ABN0AZ58_9ACTN|nr:YajQ family cyclic di-GMP-binding protein [Fannyhessea vaginae]EFL43756.1 hypothetical protein HMPREF9248_0146 [Fannyhessea vaginae PB189-T1-4]